MRPVDSPGARANRTGVALEQLVDNALWQMGWAHRRQIPVGRKLWGDSLVVDFLIDPDQSPEFPKGFAIECKWQEKTGSVDEKFPWLYLNIVRGSYPVPVVVIADGGGARPQAIAWLRQEVDGVRFAKVFTIVEFMKWLNRQPRLPFRLIGR